MANLWDDFASTDAEPQARPMFSAPIPGVATNYVLTQPFAQKLDDFVALALNTPHPDYPSYLLVEESDKQYVAGGEIRWNRKYAQIPAQHIEFGTYSYSFIGFLGRYLFTNGLLTGPAHRERFQASSLCKVQYDYFLVASANDLLNIPIVQESRYYWGNKDAGGNITATNLQTDYLFPHDGYAEATVPTQDDYEAMIAADAADATSFSLVAEASNVTRWLGNIMRRSTKYIKAI